MGTSVSRIQATDNWRKHHEWVATLGTKLGSGWKVSLLSQEDEALGQSQCAFRLMKVKGGPEDGSRLL